MSSRLIKSITQHPGEVGGPGLKVNQTGPTPIPGSVGSFDGLVAARGFGSFSVFTSPNQRFVPEFAIAQREITAYRDGRWGHHEYSRWPQAFEHSLIHVACIPRLGSPYVSSSSIVWHTWGEEDWTTQECGIPRYGRLIHHRLKTLDETAQSTIIRLRCHAALDPKTLEGVEYLTLCLNHCVDRLRLLPAEREVVIALAAHAQRLILELLGLQVFMDHVRPRIEQMKDCRQNVLDVLGAHTHDPSVAQMLHRAGIPVWFQQNFSNQVKIWSVVNLEPLPDAFSSETSFPRLVLTTRDLSGTLNLPGEWQRAMKQTVQRLLCSSRLPLLSRDDSTSVEALAVADSFQRRTIARHERRVRTLESTLAVASSSRPTKKRGRRGEDTQSLQRTVPRSGFLMNPFRKHYSSATMHLSPVWITALAEMGSLPQPSQSVTYYFPPPWMLDTLIGYDAPQDRRQRYLHQCTQIHLFCRVRLFDPTVAGRPLTISEWRDALWGEYNLDVDPEHGSLGSSRSQPEQTTRDAKRIKVCHGSRQSLRELFGKLGALSSYSPEARTTLGSIEISLDSIKNEEPVLKWLVWHAHETNWRCELLALDSVMVGSADWPELERWRREAHVSEVWGPLRSGMSICPEVDEDDVPYFWDPPPQDGWEESRPHLQAFSDLLMRWPGCPTRIRELAPSLKNGAPDVCAEAQRILVQFYVQTFVAKFQRLPTPPARSPTLAMPASTSEAHS